MTDLTQVLAQKAKRDYVRPPGGGRWTNPACTMYRLVKFSRATLDRLRKLAKALCLELPHDVGPMQVASMLLELSLDGELLPELALEELDAE